MALRIKELFDSLLRRKSKTYSVDEDDSQYSEEELIRAHYSNEFYFPKKRGGCDDDDEFDDESSHMETKKVYWTKNKYRITNDAYRNSRRFNEKENRVEEKKIQVEFKEKRVCEMYKTKSGLRVSWKAKCKRTGGSTNSKCRCSNCRAVFLIQDSLRRSALEDDKKLETITSTTPINKLKEEVNYLQNKVKFLESNRDSVQFKSRETQYSMITIQDAQTSDTRQEIIRPPLHHNDSPLKHPTWNFKTRKEAEKDLKELSHLKRSIDKKIKESLNITLTETIHSLHTTNEYKRKGIPRRTLKDETTMSRCSSSNKSSSFVISPVNHVNIVGERFEDDCSSKDITVQTKSVETFKIFNDQMEQTTPPNESNQEQVINIHKNTSQKAENLRSAYIAPVAERQISNVHSENLQQVHPKAVQNAAEEESDILNQFRANIEQKFKQHLENTYNKKDLPNLQTMMTCNTELFEIPRSSKPDKEMKENESDKKMESCSLNNSSVFDTPSTCSSRRSNIHNIKIIKNFDSNSVGINTKVQKISKIPVRKTVNNKKKGFFSIIPISSRSRPRSLEFSSKHSMKKKSNTLCKFRNRKEDCTIKRSTKVLQRSSKSNILETGDQQSTLSSKQLNNGNLEKFINLLEKLNGDKTSEKNINLIHSLKKIDECNENLEWLSDKL